MTREKYGQAYEQGLPLTVNHLCARGERIEEARETAQAAWTRGWERISQLRDESAVTEWVNAIARNLRRSYYRQSLNCSKYPVVDLKTGVNLAAIDLGLILKRCRPSDRLLLELTMRGVEEEEIARKEGVTVAAIRIRLCRARRAARSHAKTPRHMRA